MSAGFQAETMWRRESGFFLMPSMSCVIWSISPPLPSGQCRHWWP
jgi:hypothetical protein